MSARRIDLIDISVVHPAKNDIENDIKVF